MKHYSFADFQKNQQEVERALTTKGALRLSRSDLAYLARHLDSLKLPQKEYDMARACAARLTAGKSFSVSLAQLKDLEPQASDDDGQVIAMAEPVSTTLVVIVLGAALLGGMATGYLLSDAADGDEGQSDTVINNNGDGNVDIRNEN